VKTSGTDIATLTVDLAALRANWRLLADMVAPAECAAVVKADAYGTGLAPAVRALLREGATTFFVARLSEGRVTRELAPNATIYVLDGLVGDPQNYLAHDLRPVLGSTPEIDAWARAAGRAHPAALHVDTGMNRLGVPLGDIAQATSLLAGVDVALILSHFSSSEHPDAAANKAQQDRFASARGLGRTASLANSSGIFLASRPWFDLVRPGYALYGGNPQPGQPNPMRPVVSLNAPILQVRDIAAGDSVGYNSRWTARRPSRIATIAAGYADGIPRGAAGTDERAGPEVAIAGVRCPIAGRISMDLITVDVTDIPPQHTQPGMPVEILGATIGIDEFGERAGTIGYEILTSLGRRYERVYRSPH
jgi:alanine racemase